MLAFLHFWKPRDTFKLVDLIHNINISIPVTSHSHYRNMRWLICGDGRRKLLLLQLVETTAEPETTAEGWFDDHSVSTFVIVKPLDFFYNMSVCTGTELAWTLQVRPDKPDGSCYPSSLWPNTSSFLEHCHIVTSSGFATTCGVHASSSACCHQSKRGHTKDILNIMDIFGMIKLSAWTLII